jgi:PmbA protein
MDIMQMLKAEAEQVEVVEMQNEATTIEFESNKLKTSKVEETRGIAARVVRHGRLGFAASTDMDALEKLSANVLESASYGDKIPLNFPGFQPATRVQTFDATVAELPIARLVEIGREVIEILLAVEPAALINISLNRGVQKMGLRTHAGADIAFDRSPLSISVEVNRVEGDDVLITGDYVGATIWDADYLAFAHRLADQLRLAKTLTTIRPGNMPVVFSPSGALALMLPLAEGLDGKNVYTGTSPIAKKVGETLFDEKLTIVDDATLDGRFGSAPYDDEGVPHRCNRLVERGALQGFYYDLKTAAQSGVESTGNGSRSLFGLPAPSLTNFMVMPGDTALKDLLASIDEGILVEDLLGLGQGNILSGAFSNPLSLAFKIEKGEIVGRVKDISISGNIYELLKNVSALSRETQWVYSTFSAPYILLPELNVVGKN